MNYDDRLGYVNKFGGGVTFYTEYLLLIFSARDKRKKYTSYAPTYRTTAASDPIDKSQGRQIAPLRRTNLNSTHVKLLHCTLTLDRRSFGSEIDYRSSRNRIMLREQMYTCPCTYRTKRFAKWVWKTRMRQNQIDSSNFNFNRLLSAKIYRDRYSFQCILRVDFI